MPAIQPALRRFSYKQVQLGDSRLLEQLLHNRSLFMSISDDKLLKPFRVRARQSAPGKDMGGWYDVSDDFHIDPNGYGSANWHGYIPGHSFGQYLSGLSRCYAASGDAAIQRKIRDLVQKYAATIHHEPYTLPEHLFLAWQAGMGERYKHLAARYLQDEALFDPLARGQSPLKGKHAYSHVNALNSAVQAYLVQGDRKYLDAARNGFAFVQAQSYATGGWGPNEELLAADDTETLLASLSETHRSFETPCGAYGHFKIARSLLQITKSSHYGDSMERVLYNTVLGARPTLADGSTFYYADYADSARKVFRGEAWPCCSGTFIQLAADYGISAYLQADQALYVNLYVPSSVQMAVAGQPVTIEQKTSYPLTNTSTLTVRAARASEFTMQLRIPAWAGPDTRILVNDVQVELTIAPGAFLPLSRVWQPGDRLQIDFDMRTRLESIHPAHPDVVSLLVGPLVLFPLLPAPAVLHRDQLLQAKRVAPALWQIDAEGVVIKLKPFMEIGDEAYRLYTRVRALKV
jgi:DUF1680 family protein